MRRISNTTAFLIAICVVPVLLVGSVWRDHEAKPPIPAGATVAETETICDPTTTNPYLIRECVRDGGKITPALTANIAAQEAATEARIKAAEDAAALAKALVPDGSQGGLETTLRKSYEEDIAKYGKHIVAICAASGDFRAYARCINISAALAR